MNVWLVIPAWRRYAVTRLCLAQKGHLRRELVARGITADVVVVADDQNLDIAVEHGFHTVEQRNLLGRKVNDGIQYACERGADYVAFVGSDDWIHPDFFAPLSAFPKRAIAGHHISVVDLEAGKLRRLGVRGPDGVSPWLLPRETLLDSSFRPANDDATSGMEGQIRRGLGACDWSFWDPHDLARVDFKTSENMTSYKRITGVLGYGTELDQPWEHLASRYGDTLAALARETHDQYAFEAAA